MKTFRENIWQTGEYAYEAAYGFEPNIRAYLHEDGTMHDCMIIVPGGGYCMVVPPEAQIPALEFFGRGMNVFVLTYTTDITMSVPLLYQPMNDAARALRFIRSRAGLYGIEGKKIFMCGFSAGAHVCGSLAVHYKDVVDPNPAYETVSARPDGVILSYPVITLGKFTHIYSAQALIGHDLPEDLTDYFSLEKHVSTDTPPCFIWQTRDDNLVPVENSYLFADALREKGVMYAHYVFPGGFHGLSVPNADFFKGEFPDFTMEQVENAVEAVKEGRGINVTPERVAELKAQFPDEEPSGGALKNAEVENAGGSSKDADNVSQNEPVKEQFDPLKAFADVAMWPELAMLWMSRI
ncbi:MAG: alpha/beta hydrolase [Lachnospiraceae bacterium]|nr:alpha/beta hydrolase [Lachnospiraceae bacterium]